MSGATPRRRKYTLCKPHKMSAVLHRAYGVWLLGVRWASGWNSVPKAKRRSYSMWVRRHA